jgi:hypothetical protein
MGNRRNLIIAATFGIIPAAMTLALEYIAHPSSNPIVFAIQGASIALLFPGMLGSMAVSGNVHAFHLWVGAVINFILYFLLCWAIAALVGRLHLRFRASRRANNI